MDKDLRSIIKIKISGFIKKLPKFSNNYLSEKFSYCSVIFGNLMTHD